MSQLSSPEMPLPPRLRLNWALFALVCALVWVAGIIAWLSWGYVDFVGRWLVLSGATLLVLLGSLWRGLGQNHRHGEAAILPALGAGNTLTLLRGVLVALLAGFLFSPRPGGWQAWMPGIIFSLAALADLFDGYLARRENQATLLGEGLDMLVDGLGMLIAAGLLVGYGQAPGWYLLVGLARYLFTAGVWLRQRSGWRVLPLDANPARRPFAGAQMGFCAVALYPLFDPQSTRLVATFFAIPFVIGFLRDWLAVCGAFLPAPAETLRPVVIGELLRRLQPGLGAIWARWGGVLTLVARTFTALAAGFAVAAYLQAYLGLVVAGENKAGALISLVLALSGLIGIATGLAGRGAAIALMLAAGLGHSLQVLGGFEPALLALATAVFFLGTGSWSVWTPERTLIRRRLGEA